MIANLHHLQVHGHVEPHLKALICTCQEQKQQQRFTSMFVRASWQMLFHYLNRLMLNFIQTLLYINYAFGLDLS